MRIMSTHFSRFLPPKSPPAPGSSQRNHIIPVEDSPIAVAVANAFIRNNELTRRGSCSPPLNDISPARGLSTLSPATTMMAPVPKPLLLWYAFDTKRKQVTAHTFGPRTDETCRHLLALLKPFSIGFITTDDWGSYEREVPREIHLSGKIFTQRIERHNLNLRTHIK